MVKLYRYLYKKFAPFNDKIKIRREVFRKGNALYEEISKESLEYALYNPKGKGKKSYKVNFDDGYEIVIAQTREQSYEDIVGPTQLYQYQYIEPYLKSSNAVLDVACGTGYGSKFLVEHNAVVYGVDISNEVINFATHRYPEIQFIQSSADNLPFEDNFFDVIVSVETVEHIHDDISFLKEVHRVLKPNGKILLTTPHHGFGNPFHVREYYRNEFVSLLSQWFDPKKWVWIKDDGKWMELICTK